MEAEGKKVDREEGGQEKVRRSQRGLVEGREEMIIGRGKRGI